MSLLYVLSIEALSRKFQSLLTRTNGINVWSRAIRLFVITDLQTCAKSHPFDKMP